MFLDCCTAGLVSSINSSDIRTVVLHTHEIVSSSFVPIDLIEPLILYISLFSSAIESFNSLTS